MYKVSGGACLVRGNHAAHISQQIFNTASTGLNATVSCWKIAMSSWMKHASCSPRFSLPPCKTHFGYDLYGADIVRPTTDMSMLGYAISKTHFMWLPDCFWYTSSGNQKLSHIHAYMQHTSAQIGRDQNCPLYITNESIFFCSISSCSALTQPVPT